MQGSADLAQPEGAQVTNAVTHAVTQAATQATGLDKSPGPVAEPADVAVGALPHVTIHAFRETEAFGAVWDRVAADRHLVGTTARGFDGGFAGAVQHYSREPTPDLIIVETTCDAEIMQYEADALAEVCDPGTQLIVIGHQNDIALYRKLVGMGAQQKKCN